MSTSRFLRSDDQAEYTKKVSQISRLRRLLNIENARQAQLDDELKHHYDVLEIRSRRRAYLNKSLVGGVRSKEFELALALPATSSPLAMRSWTCEEYEYAPDEDDLSSPACIDYDDYDKYDLRPKRTKRTWRGGSLTSTPATTAAPRLFPVTEHSRCFTIAHCATEAR